MKLLNFIQLTFFYTLYLGIYDTKVYLKNIYMKFYENIVTNKNIVLNSKFFAKDVHQRCLHSSLKQSLWHLNTQHSRMTIVIFSNLNLKSFLNQQFSIYIFYIQTMGKLTAEYRPEQQKQNKTSAQQSNFILKAYEIVNSEQNWDIIHWSKSGYTFIIEDIQQFQKVILPRYFRHNRYQSFVRQLNMYDFHKVRNGDYYCQNKSEFRHEEFYRSNYPQILQIKRKGFQAKTQVGGLVEPSKDYQTKKSSRGNGYGHNKKIRKRPKNHHSTSYSNKNSLSAKKQLKTNKQTNMQNQQIIQRSQQNKQLNINSTLKNKRQQPYQALQARNMNQYSIYQEEQVSVEIHLSEEENQLQNPINADNIDYLMIPGQYQSKQPYKEICLHEAIQSAYEKLINYFTNEKKEKYWEIANDKKFHYNIEIAQTVKQYWAQEIHQQQKKNQAENKRKSIPSYANNKQELKIMMDLYHRVKSCLQKNTAKNNQSDKSHEPGQDISNKQNLINIIRSYQNLPNNSQLMLQLIAVDDQQQIIIESIFKKDIRSTLISINSETFLNHELAKKNDMLMMGL